MIFLQVILNFYYTGWLMVVGLSPIARLWDLGGGMPSVGVFLRVLARIYASFGENHR